jgi:cyanobactin biosynthesis protein (PatB/AcyB/McaB family)
MNHTPRQDQPAWRDFKRQCRAPVERPEIIPPHAGVEVTYGAADDLVRYRIYLLHGANFNDPPGWRFPSYETLKTSGRS